MTLSITSRPESGLQDLATDRLYFVGGAALWLVAGLGIAALLW